MTDPPHDTDSLHRPPPRIIRVPLPDRDERTWFDYACVGALTLVATLGSFLFAPAPMNWISAALVPIFTVPFFGAAFALDNRKYRKFCRAYRATADPFTPCPLARALLAEWKRPSSPPKPLSVRTVLRRLAPAECDCATVVCFGIPQQPGPGHYQFEPEIITPTHTLRTQIIYLSVGLVLLALLALGFLPGFPWRSDLNCFYGVLGLSLIAGMVWVWKTAVRATYVRIAPRMIQFLRYTGTGRRPEIRSYPIEDGTLALMARTAEGVTLTLWRDGREDRLNLSKLMQSRRFTDGMWHALLSTAPTPPLSDEELVG